MPKIISFLNKRFVELLPAKTELEIFWGVVEFTGVPFSSCLFYLFLLYYLHSENILEACHMYLILLLSLSEFSKSEAWDKDLGEGVPFPRDSRSQRERGRKTMREWEPKKSVWISCPMDTQACEALREYPSEFPPEVTRLESLSTNSHPSHPEHPSLPSVPPQMGWAELPKQGSAQADSPWASGCGQVQQPLPHLLIDSWSQRQVNAASYLRGTNWPALCKIPDSSGLMAMLWGSKNPNMGRWEASPATQWLWAPEPPFICPLSPRFVPL